jgi:hypothetical protein
VGTGTEQSLDSKPASATSYLCDLFPSHKIERTIVTIKPKDEARPAVSAPRSGNKHTKVG